VQPNKVYVGGLPEHTRQEDLQSCFGKIGNVVNIELKYVVSLQWTSAYPLLITAKTLGSDMALSYVISRPFSRTRS
jgi:RNA recognition motif-containing protein